MVIKDYNTKVEVYPYEDIFNHIDVYKPHTSFKEFHEAEVNWSCLGAQTPENAKLYGEALVKAAQIAAGLNKQCPGGIINGQ